MKITLASGSPRRREILSSAGLSFEIIISAAEEIYDLSLGMTGLCEENARLKATSISSPGSIIIAADTLVFLSGEVLGKPKTMLEAHDMIRRLQGRTHQVCTGVCVIDPQGQTRIFSEVSDVTFLPLTDEEIHHYLIHTNPLDKAGAYGIQDKEHSIVEKISGNIDNVMGLPLAMVLACLAEIEQNS